jgi:large subunit ribosomal protein L5
MNLKQQYTKKIQPELMKELEIKNLHATPALDKVVLNVGLGRASQHTNFKDKILPGVIEELGLISGQKPAPRPAKKSIAGFKLREGNIIGASSTLRGQRMYDFVEKLVTTVIPRLRDFRGIDLKSVDESGSLNLGFKDQMVFAEINPDISHVDFGLQITVVPTTRNREEAILLYRKLGFLFKKNT